MRKISENLIFITFQLFIWQGVSNAQAVSCASQAPSPSIIKKVMAESKSEKCKQTLAKAQDCCFGDDPKAKCYWNTPGEHDASLTPPPAPTCTSFTCSAEYNRDVHEFSSGIANVRAKQCDGAKQDIQRDCDVSSSKEIFAAADTVKECFSKIETAEKASAHDSENQRVGTSDGEEVGCLPNPEPGSYCAQFVTAK